MNLACPNNNAYNWIPSQAAVDALLSSDDDDDDLHQLTSISTEDTSSCSSDNDCAETVRSLFSKAYALLNPSRLFRAVTYLYAERKLLVFYWCHCIATLVIWTHFFLIKFYEQRSAVKLGAPNYWFKRIAPPLEFGTMHAILFQLTLIPLTMCRYSIASLSRSVLDNYIPVNRSMRIHIYLAYLLVSMVFIATVFFFAFFGRVCATGEKDFCAKFRSEIMITGYVILGTLLIVAITSFYRHSMPYELFYAIHHLVFGIFALTILHTFDNVQRNTDKQRSQTFKWFAITVIYYLCDRLAMHFHHSYHTHVVACSAVQGTGSSRMMVVRLKRPPLFRFQPGQYAFVKISRIDCHWHPFSIASGPSSSYLEFYIEVTGYWTQTLWTLLEEAQDAVEAQVMGPCGSVLAKTEDYSHALAIGTGTGIVPILSLFKQQVRQLVRLAPEAHFEDLKEYQKRVLQVEVSAEACKGSMAQHLLNTCRAGTRYEQLIEKSRTEELRESIRNVLINEDGTTNVQELKAAAYKTTRSIYGVVMLGLMPVVGVALIGFTISWNTLHLNLPRLLFALLQAATVMYQFAFGLIAVCIWDANQFYAYTDFALCAVAPFADWYWFRQYSINGVLSPPEITTYFLLVAYMLARSWSMTVKPRSSRRSTVEADGNRTMERLDVVWVTRSASLVSEILPDVNSIWCRLVSLWGLKHATSVCRFSVYVTDPNPAARQVLARELSNTLLYQNGFVHFGRPDIGAIIENHSIDMICNHRSSNTLLAYVGSQELSTDIHECKLFNDMKISITGNKKHQMDFVSENYGGVKPKSLVSEVGFSVKDGVVEIEDAENNQSTLSTRRTLIYGGDFQRSSVRQIRAVKRPSL